MAGGVTSATDSLCYGGRVSKRPGVPMQLGFRPGQTASMGSSSTEVLSLNAAVHIPRVFPLSRILPDGDSQNSDVAELRGGRNTQQVRPATATSGANAGRWQGGTWWHFLGSYRPILAGGLTGKPSGREPTQAEATPGGGALDFLDPPEKPGHLGKFAHYETWT
jgi:hypothetical protein